MCVKQCQPMPAQRKPKIQMRSADSKTQKFQLAYNSCSGISGVLSFLIRMYYDMTNRFGSGARLQDSIGAANSWMHRKVWENHFWRWVLDVLDVLGGRCYKPSVSSLSTQKLLSSVLAQASLSAWCGSPGLAWTNVQEHQERSILERRESAISLGRIGDVTRCKGSTNQVV